MKTLFLIVFIDLVGFGIMLPLLPFYAQHFGAAPQMVTLLFGIYSVGQFIASPLLGRLSDKVGRRPILVGSLVCSIAAWCIIANAQSLGWLFAGRLFAGLTAGNIATAQAYIADVTTPANRAKGMGLLGAAFGMGFIFGPVLGGVLAGADPAHVNFAMPAYFSAGLSAVALCGTVFLSESLTPARRAALAQNPRPGRIVATKRVFAKPALKQLILSFFLITTAMAMMETSFTIWVNARFGWGPNHVGYIFAYIGIVLAAIQGGAIGPLSKRYGETAVVILGAASLLIGLAALPFSPVPLFMYAASTLIAIGYGLCQPSFNSLISKEADAEDTGLVMGVAQSAASLSRVVGPLLSGAAFAYVGLKAPFSFAALLMVPILLSVLHLHKARRSNTPAT
jgi:DHA1 family tetracycline resistance protein-like MFS transporter